jgi:hypothetical protein
VVTSEESGHLRGTVGTCEEQWAQARKYGHK